MQSSSPLALSPSAYWYTTNTRTRHRVTFCASSPAPQVKINNSPFSCFLASLLLYIAHQFNTLLLFFFFSHPPSHPLLVLSLVVSRATPVSSNEAFADPLPPGTTSSGVYNKKNSFAGVTSSPTRSSQMRTNNMLVGTLAHSTRLQVFSVPLLSLLETYGGASIYSDAACRIRLVSALHKPA